MELTAPEKTPFQQVNKLLKQQTHRADLQPKTNSRLPCSVSAKEQKTLGQLQNFGLKTTENEFGPTTMSL
ncbi:TPA: hypothetical protein NJ007_004521 [Vibrio parahaemolyticus]|nr:hypothetical protein [Vibrio parahaemolyticus]ALG51994.1 hypothetical protein FORC6_1668 [Vibrio parahaemolyticus]EIV8661061.1 hypothetical protein [Vibrio parahaemolyticus]MBE4030672.1 hypothetical protein [Vibrio parahaemolyticus]MBE4485195.1 hypothetical protein [Vibrio parahaemolyticus]MBE5150842.1 hypothetical protein [Vibrio parahaemolyticus]